jgi:hypothetical protein
MATCFGRLSIVAINLVALNGVTLNINRCV